MRRCTPSTCANLDDVAIATPLGSAPRARPNVALLDAPAVDVYLGKGAAVAIGSDWPKNHFTGSDHRSEALLCRSAARLAHFGRVDVRQSHLLPIADQRVAIDGNAALPRGRWGRRCEHEDSERDSHTRITREREPRRQPICSQERRRPPK